jgi:glycosyltransferase involved in cell wall biosynthesis
LKRILFIDQYRNYGGGQIVLLQAMRCALADGWKISLLAPLGGDFQSLVRSQLGDVEFLPLPEMMLHSGRKGAIDVVRLGVASFRMRKYLPPPESFDLVYVNGPRLFLAASLWFRSKPNAVVYHVHLDYSAIAKRLINWISKRESTRAIITVSSFVDAGLRAFAPRIRRVILAENGLTEADAARPYVSRFTKTGPLKAAVIGQVCPQKGQSIVVDLAAKIPDCQFFMIGDTDFGERTYCAQLRARAPANVTWLGKSANWRDQIDRYGIQLSIMPSQFEEGLPLVAIESMANSLLTVVIARGGLLDVAQRTGAIVFHIQEELLQQLTTIQAMSPADADRLAFEQF